MTISSSSHDRPLLGLRRRPGRLALRFMRMPLAAYRHGWGYLLGRSFVEFDHVGRKSGKSYEAVAMVLGYNTNTREVVICRAWETDWYRNVQAHPATRMTIGRESFVPGQQRLLAEDEAFGVAVRFRRDHPYRMRLISKILGWGDMRNDAIIRRFVHEHPFLAFRPATPP